MALNFQKSARKIKKSVIDPPPTIRDGRVPKENKLNLYKFRSTFCHWYDQK